jgi:hypothetical protein
MTSVENTGLHQQKVEKVFWAFSAFWRFLKIKFAFGRFCQVQWYKLYSVILHPQFDVIFNLGIVFPYRYSLVGYISYLIKVSYFYFWKM